MKAFKTLLKIECKLSLRGMDMVIFAILMPIAVTIILGAVFGSRPAFEGASYSFLAQSFGAVSTIAVCAGGVMGLPLVISDYRNKKILKRLKVTPVRPGLILAVETVVYALYSICSLLLVYGTAAIFFGYRLGGSWPLFLAAYFLVMVSMFSIGLMVGGLAPNTKTAGMIASILYFPMLIFSGATLPYEVMPRVMQNLADLMPLTQGIKLLKAMSLGLQAGEVFLPIVIMLSIAVICTGISIRFFRWE
ncbi:ABC transporter permease [Anoxybacterium hadale]|uniref:ABC transporter permease n=1 Tax=Anoxybacterium hadale TaxID=3408580 RepID=A0ACD1A9L2_9FIRM|nr:ABC transporter permease [Clostridiales bacterium]